jgi:hypothetical protein
MKLKSKSKHVSVSVNIKDNVLIDNYKIQQYINELNQLIQSHINKGNN